MTLRNSAIDQMLKSISWSDLGIGDWGYTENPDAISFRQFLAWTEDNSNAPLPYLFDARKNLRESLKLIFPKFKSALVFIFPYQNYSLDQSQYKVANYSMMYGGQDYHVEIPKKLDIIKQALHQSLHPLVGHLETFSSTDVAPILERDLAYRAGLGWFGKNSLLIHKKFGSQFLIASILLNTKIPGLTSNDRWEADHCGSCRACLISCPTQAIMEDARQIVAQKCIATFTIEIFRDNVAPPTGYGLQSQEIFGCDICQDVCPWNQKILQNSASSGINTWPPDSTKNKALHPGVEHLFNLTLPELKATLLQMSNREFKRYLHGTPFARTGRIGLLKNVEVLLGTKHS